MPALTLHLIKAFVMLRLRQLKRIMEGLGLFRFIFLVGILVGAGISLISLLLQSEQFQVAVGVLLLSVFMLQTQRKDLTFLKINFPQYQKIIWAEYLFLSLPFFILLLYMGQWILILATILGLSLIPFYHFKIQRKSLNTILQQLIPATAFEWKAGVRKNFIFIILVWVAGLGFSFYQGAVPLALFVLGLIPLKFFEVGESLPILLASEKPSGKFFVQKIKDHVQIFTIMCTPLLLAFCAFHWDIWYIAVAEFLLLISLHLYFIFMKYAWYQPNQKPGGMEVFAGIGAVGIIIPIFLPLVWLLTIWFYFKAASNLKLYLNDYH
jgi:hypothetical protein